MSGPSAQPLATEELNERLSDFHQFTITAETIIESLNELSQSAMTLFLLVHSDQTPMFV